MAKSQMQLANKAWRNVSKNYEWHTHFPSKKAWKTFCREKAKYTALDAIDDNDPLKGYSDAELRVQQEIMDWF
ncbi:hypothetical protein GKC49_09460 [Pantoea agglomerans]|uniref:Uncharacterized protein n=1 Tax=Enterobacter agglomerans TaxID=549 RepID=A0A7X2MLH6_ENTAG|nr:hypothetical protein [Pantoea agglomerans]